MKAARKDVEGKFVVEEVPDLQLPAPDWVKARIRVAGICGTDLRHWKKHEPELECHIMGHELAGEVVEVGPAVTNVRPGDRVVIESVLGCGQCEWCRVQQYNRCPDLYPTRTKSVSKAYAEHVIGPAEKFYRLPDHVSFEEAALIDTFSVCLHAQHLAALKVNERVAVLGAGPIGLGQMMLAKATGADVLITDVVDSALDLARELGADEVVNSAREDAVARVMEWTGGRGVDVAFECAGGPAMPETLPQATLMARRGGRVVIVGGFDKGPVSIPLEWQRIQMSEITLIPSASFAVWDGRPEQGQVLDMIAKGRIDVRKLITHRFPIDRINEAFDVAQAKEATGAVFVAVEI
ncbi:MAG TPA: zinc-binding dehydrogenase [Sphingomonas sp.]|nr:zinc-binding dehydrogenase [Sphingomonas sp.]